jgi:hypothetical protein
MSRTRRQHDFRTTRHARRDVQGYVGWGGRFYPFEENGDMSKRRTLAILRGDDGRIRYDKCSTARIDSEGGWKLDTWSESPSKHNDAHRRRRKADKILARRQLEDVD